LDQPPERQPAPVSGRTLRLTFRVAGGQIELVSVERLEMVTPPQVGEPPRAGTHGGQWIELRDSQNQVSRTACLRQTKAVDDDLVEHLRKWGIDLPELLQCVEGSCDASLEGTPENGSWLTVPWA
jgi:hypothetical protein